MRGIRGIDDIELVGGGSILDRLYRAEKHGWASAADQMQDIYAAVATMTPVLLGTVPKVIAYAAQIPRYPTP